MPVEGLRLEHPTRRPPVAAVNLAGFCVCEVCHGRWPADASPVPRTVPLALRPQGAVPLHARTRAPRAHDPASASAQAGREIGYLI